MLMTSPENVLHITEALGVQALIASLPLSCFNDTLLHFSYIDKTSSALVDRPFFKFISKFFSEYLLIDWQNEGGSESFNSSIPKLAASLGLRPQILFGGITGSRLPNSLLDLPHVSAIAIGNSLSYSEHAIQFIKDYVSLDQIRAPFFSID